MIYAVSLMEINYEECLLTGWNTFLMWILRKTDYHTYMCVMTIKTDDVWMIGYRIPMMIYMLVRCVSEMNCEWYMKLHVEKCKVCTDDMDSTRNTDFMCPMCCTCQ